MNMIGRKFQFRGVIPDRSKSLTIEDAKTLDHFFIVQLGSEYFSNHQVYNNRLYLTDTKRLSRDHGVLWRDDSSLIHFRDKIPFANYWDAWAFFNKMIEANK